MSFGGAELRAVGPKGCDLVIWCQVNLLRLKQELQMLCTKEVLVSPSEELFSSDMPSEK